jgi:hypothetical protein
MLNAHHVGLDNNQWKEVLEILEEQMVNCHHIPPLRARFLRLEAIRDKIFQDIRLSENLPELPKSARQPDNLLLKRAPVNDIPMPEPLIILAAKE